MAREKEMAASAAADGASHGAFLDTAGNPLEIGAMYCCVIKAMEPGEFDQYNELVRYAGNGNFVDADTLEECSPDWDALHRQAVPVIDLGSA